VHDAVLSRKPSTYLEKSHHRSRTSARNRKSAPVAKTPKSVHPRSPTPYPVPAVVSVLHLLLINHRGTQRSVAKMKLYYVGVLDNTKQPAIQLTAAHELSEYSRFTKNEYANFMTMISKTVAERTKPGQRQSVEEQDYVVHCYARSEGIAGVVITKEYPHIAAHSVLSKLMDQFLSEVPLATIQQATKDGDVSFPAIQDYLNNYQDANAANSIAKIQQELDETKIILHKAIDSVLQRGEKLEDLVQKSSDLSSQSKMFYKSAKKQNSCCILM